VTLTFELDLDSVKMNQHDDDVVYLGQRSFSSKVIVRTHRHTYTHPTDCTTWTTIKVVDKIYDFPVITDIRGYNTPLENIKPRLHDTT